MADTSLSQIGASHSIREAANVARGTKGSVPSGKVFAELLDSRIRGDLNFSKHAQARLASRDISLSEGERGRLAEATSEAAKRGAHEALLLMGQMGFIVSVPSRTVITALDSSRMDGGVITGIDTAVMVAGE